MDFSIYIQNWTKYPSQVADFGHPWIPWLTWGQGKIYCRCFKSMCVNGVWIFIPIRKGMSKVDILDKTVRIWHRKYKGITTCDCCGILLQGGHEPYRSMLKQGQVPFVSCMPPQWFTTILHSGLWKEKEERQGNFQLECSNSLPRRVNWCRKGFINKLINFFLPIHWWNVSFANADYLKHAVKNVLLYHFGVLWEAQIPLL